MLILLIIALMGKERIPPWLIMLGLAAEIFALNILIAANGAASNPYSSVLLLPLAVGLMVLPFGWALATLVVSVVGQLNQLVVPMANHHHDMMAEHARGMIVSFVITSVLLASLVGYFRRQLDKKRIALQHHRERQLRDEQLLAIGTAAAQLAHDAATPVQTLQLLAEELAEGHAVNDVSDVLIEHIQRLNKMLVDWRDVADDIREARQSDFPLLSLMKSIQHTLRMTRPEANIEWHIDASFDDYVIRADRTLLPAIASIVVNACQAVEREGQGKVFVNSIVDNDQWILRISNPVSSHLVSSALGNRFVSSDKGAGVGAVVSNASIEKCGGKVSWQTNNGLFSLDVTLPVRHIQ